MAKTKLTKEEKLQQKAQMQKIRELWQALNIKDLASLNEGMNKIKK